MRGLHGGRPAFGSGPSYGNNGFDGIVRTNGTGPSSGHPRHPRLLWSEWPRFARRLVAPGPLLTCVEDGDLLSPTSRHPETAAGDLTRALAGLARSPGVQVAVLSAERIEELERRLPEGLWLIGRRGLELRPPGGGRDPGWARSGVPTAAVSLDALRRLAERFQGCLPDLRVEDRGTRLTLDVGAVPEADGRAVARIFAGAAAGCRGVRVFQDGRRVEVVPAADDDGRVVQRLRDLLAPGGTALYVAGNGTSDQTFALLEENGATTVRVGPEAPSRARYRLDGARDLVSLLCGLARLRTGDQESADGFSGTRGSMTRPSRSGDTGLVR